MPLCKYKFFFIFHSYNAVTRLSISLHGGGPWWHDGNPTSYVEGGTLVAVREKGRGAMWESTGTGSYFSLVLTGGGGGDVTQVEWGR